MLTSIRNLFTALFPAKRAVPASRELYLLRLFCIRLLLIAGVFGVLVLLSGCAGHSQPAMSQAEQAAPVMVKKQIAELGIEVMAMRLTAGGNMLDFRFKVLTADKAMPLFREDIFPYLIDQKTEIPFKVTDTTKVGPMRPTSRDPREGKVYFMFFRNPHKFLQSGQRVTVVVGEHKIKDLMIL